MKNLIMGILLGMTGLAYGADDPALSLGATLKYRIPKDTVEVISKIEMGQADGRVLYATIFRPKVLPKDPLPAIIFIHGGGWSSGSHTNMFSAWLAEKGYLVASIDYRLTQEKDGKGWKWPAQIMDCKLGVRWLRANAEKYHLDPNRIGVWGTSAGGHLSSCVGLMYDRPEFDSPGYEGVSSKVQAVGVFCGPSDLTIWNKDPRVIRLVGEDPELVKQASPALAVKAGAPPFLLVHGVDDKAVLLVHSEKLKAALEAAGNSVEYLPVKNGGHDFFLNPTTPESTIEPNHETILATLLAFFDKHLKNAPAK